MTVTKTELEKLVAKAGKRGAARLLGVSARTIGRRLEALSAGETVTRQSESDKLRELRKVNRDIARETIASQEIRDRLFNLAGYDASPPSWLSASPGNHFSGVPTLMLSDLHWGEVVNPDEVNGINHFNLQIAKQRLQTTINNAIDFCFNHINNYDTPPPGIVLILGGDMLSGDIHEELSNTNEEPVARVLFDLCDNLVGAIHRLQQAFGNVFVVTTFGNHGRTTRKPSYKQAAFTNWDWVLYNMLNRQFANNEHVRFSVSDQPDTVFSIYGVNYLLTHGDRLGTNGGDGAVGIIGPVMRGVRKIISQYADVKTRLDCVVMGHFHQLTWLPHAVINGSLKGYDEYAMSHRFEPEAPQQALWFTHPARGMTIKVPVFCEVTPEAKHQKANWVSWQA